MEYVRYDWSDVWGMTGDDDVWVGYERIYIWYSPYTFVPSCTWASSYNLRSPIADNVNGIITHYYDEELGEQHVINNQFVRYCTLCIESFKLSTLN